MRVYATELTCSTGVLRFHTFKLALCTYNKLRSHAEILNWWAFDVTFLGSNPLRSNRSGLNVSNGESWNPKFTLKVNSFWIKINGQNFAGQVLSSHTFKIPRKKGSDFFYHRGTLSGKKKRALPQEAGFSVPVTCGRWEVVILVEGYRSNLLSKSMDRAAGEEEEIYETNIHI